MADPGGGRLGRSWRRFRRRPASIQITSVAVVAVLVVGIAVAVGSGSSAKPGASTTTDTVASPVQASTSSARGVSAHEIN